ncbi:MAG: DUF3566 domain-containing protein [Chloroflexi bacterium]|nr:DUF3566 domain-containing protein [Chloroflexota bacterium]MCC6894987.1 DUF3566 domain-containing protein [Anaerolineae bacterium]
MVTIKRIEPSSAMRVGALVNAILFTVFALLWAVFQSLIITGLNSLATSVTVNGQPQAFDPSALAAAGLATCGCGYLLGVVFSAVSGGIFGLIIAFSYNLVANWFGGLRVSLEGEPEVEKRKREFAASGDDRLSG